MSLKEVIINSWLMLFVVLLSEVLLYILPIGTGECLKQVRSVSYEFFSFKRIYIASLVLSLCGFYLCSPIKDLLELLCDDLGTTHPPNDNFCTSMRRTLLYPILRFCRTCRCDLVMKWSHYIAGFSCGVLTMFDAYITFTLSHDCKEKSTDQAFARMTCLVYVLLNGWFLVVLTCTFWQNEQSAFKKGLARIKMLITRNHTTATNSTDYTSVPVEYPQDEDFIANTIDKTKIKPR